MDELRADTGDRHPSHLQKISPLPKILISRQYMMMGIGILLLLLLVMAIGSALKSMDENDAHIEESGQLVTAEHSGSTSSAGPQDIVSMTSISSKQTKTQTVQISENQKRIELPSHLNNTLTNQKNQDDSLSLSVTSTINGPSQVSSNPVVVMSAHQTSRDNNKKNNKKVAAIHKSPLKPAVKKASGSTPIKNFTLQLSSAARPDKLNAWAKKQNLSDYHVYQTTRNGQLWYVLISGSYVTSSEAKRAMALLPYEVRAQNPWVKPFKVGAAGE